MIDQITLTRVDDGQDSSGTYYSTTVPANPEEGNIWYVLGEEDNIDSILEIRRYHNSTWGTLPLTDAVFRYIHAGKLTVGTIQGPNTNTKWNLGNGEFQTSGTATVTEIDPETEQAETWTIDTDVDINNGAITIHGDHDNLLNHRSTDYATFGAFLQAINKDYWDWITDPAMSQWYPGMYAYAGLKLKGDWIDSYIQSQFTYSDGGGAVTSDSVGRFNPIGRIGPDEIVLGDSDILSNPLTDADIQAMGYEDAHIEQANAPRNKLSIRAGSFVRPEESIEFEEYYTFEETDNGLNIAFHEDSPWYYRPIWPYRPGDAVEWNDSYVATGRFYNGRKDLRFLLPLNKPVSDYVTTCTFTGYIQIVTVAGGTSITANLSVPSSAISVIKCAPTPAGLDVWLRKTTAFTNGTDNNPCNILFTKWGVTFS